MTENAVVGATLVGTIDNPDLKIPTLMLWFWKDTELSEIRLIRV